MLITIHGNYEKFENLSFFIKAIEKKDVSNFWTKSSESFLIQKTPWPKKASPNFYPRRQWFEIEQNIPKNGLIVNGTLYPVHRTEPLKNTGPYWLTPKCLMTDEAYEVYLARMKRSKDPKTNTKTRPNSLALQVKLPQYWPTPTARDWRSGKSSEATRQRNSRPLSENIGGLLNPTWVEWLMGFPLGWSKANKPCQ